MQQFFHYAFVAGVLVAMSIRWHYGFQYRRADWESAHTTALAPAEAVLMGLWGASLASAPVYVFSPWLDFADYPLPNWTGWPGLAVFAVAVWVLWRAHRDLGPHWSPRLEVRRDHKLVTEGVYNRVRHPMYAAHWLWGVAQALLLHNWIAGLSGLVFFAAFYFVRVRREERMLLRHFGEQYRSYMRRSGRVIPRLRRLPEGTQRPPSGP